MYISTIDDRIDQYIKSDAFITVKDHKESFPRKIECRLINPAKSNFGRISKQILAEAVSCINKTTGANQWTSTGEVKDWFTNLEDKSSLKFLKFDIVAFYPSISQELFDKVICWSKQFYDFTKQQLDVINNSRKSFLFLNDQTWPKKNN